MNKTTAHLAILIGLAAAGSLPALACGGGQKPADTAAAPSDSSAMVAPALDSAASTASASPADSSSAAPVDTSPLAQVLTTDSGQVGKIFDAASSAPAATLKPTATAADPLAKGIKDASKKLPAGMQPDGPMATGNLKEKGNLQTDITLQPGKCYSIVGFSKTVKDLDLYLLLPPGVLSGQDLTDDNKPIIGGAPQPMCPVAATAVTYKLDIVADSGGGDVAAQLFSKAK